MFEEVRVDTQSPRSLIATSSMFELCSEDSSNDLAIIFPILPKPLIATLYILFFSGIYICLTTMSNSIDTGLQKEI